MQGPKSPVNENSLVGMSAEGRRQLAATVTLDLKDEFSRLYSQISDKDLRDAKFGGSGPQLNPNLAAIPDLFNRLSSKVQEDILSANSVEEQQAIHDFYVLVMHECAESGNYIATQAIASAFDAVPISRLKYLTENSQFKEAKAGILGQLSDISPSQNKPGLFDPRENFGILRADIRKRQARGDNLVLPFNILSRDLTFAKEGGSDAETVTRFIANFRNVNPPISPSQGVSTDIVARVRSAGENPLSEEYYQRSQKIMPSRGTPDSYFQERKFELLVEKKLIEIIDKKLAKINNSGKVKTQSLLNMDQKDVKAAIDAASKEMSKEMKVDKKFKDNMLRALSQMNYDELKNHNAHKLQAAAPPIRNPLSPVPLVSAGVSVDADPLAKHAAAASSSPSSNLPSSSSLSAATPTVAQAPVRSAEMDAGFGEFVKAVQYMNRNAPPVAAVSKSDKTDKRFDTNDPRVERKFRELADADRRGKGKKTDKDLLKEAEDYVKQLDAPATSSTVQVQAALGSLEQRQAADVSAAKPAADPVAPAIKHPPRQPVGPSPHIKASVADSSQSGPAGSASKPQEVASAPSQPDSPSSSSSSSQYNSTRSEKRNRVLSEFVRRSQALDEVKAEIQLDKLPESVRSTYTQDSYFEMVKKAAIKAVEDKGLGPEFVPEIIDAVYSDPNVAFANPAGASPSGTYKKDPVSGETRQQKEAKVDISVFNKESASSDSVTNSRSTSPASDSPVSSSRSSSPTSSSLSDFAAAINSKKSASASSSVSSSPSSSPASASVKIDPNSPLYKAIVKEAKNKVAGEFSDIVRKVVNETPGLSDKEKEAMFAKMLAQKEGLLQKAGITTPPVAKASDQHAALASSPAPILLSAAVPKSAIQRENKPPGGKVTFANEPVSKAVSKAKKGNKP